MKPELTPELKERFFAVYYGQSVAYFNDHLKEPIPGKIDGGLMKSGVDWDDYLLLRPVASITDEEAIRIAKIVWPKHQYLHTPEEGKWYVLRERTTSPKEYLQLTDYLRSIGVAIPFMGYSVEELIEAGWIKLTPKKWHNLNTFALPSKSIT